MIVESMGPDRDQTHYPWICSQTRIFCGLTDATEIIEKLNELARI